MKMVISFEKKRKIEGLILVSPFIIGVVLYFLVPLFTAIKLSFGKIVSVQGFEIDWVGFKNYLNVITIDATFIPTFINVIKDSFIKLPLIIIFSLIMAILVNMKIKGKGFYRAAFFLPFLLGTGVVFEQLIKMGVTNNLLSLESTGISADMIAYLGANVSSAINSFFGIIVIVLWSCGVQILLYLSGLQGISTSLYEAASVEGATAWEMFWKITLPMIMPIMLVNIIYTISDSFTNIGNPIIKYSQTVAFKFLRFEDSAAIGCLYLTFIMILTGIIFLILGRNNLYDGKVNKNAKFDR